MPVTQVNFKNGAFSDYPYMYKVFHFAQYLATKGKD